MKRYIQFLFIILAGEAIFMLPFLLPRVFRPMMLESWGLTHQDIGFAFSLYGLSAMVSYLLGGPIADKFQPRLLISLSLFLTAMGGLVLYFTPGKLTLYFVYFYFGISTILFMWGAMIKASYQFSGQSSKATTMGFLDGGRGLSAAMMGWLLVKIASFHALGGASVDHYTITLERVLLTVIVFLILLSIFCFYILKDIPSAQTITWRRDLAKDIIKKPETWALSIIIIAAYTGFKSVDYFAVYLVDIYNYSAEQASEVTSHILWLRPIGAIGLGFVADFIFKRFNLSRFLFLFFILLLNSLSFLLLLNQLITPALAIIFLSSAALFSCGLRAIYFSVFDELKIRPVIVGTMVGVISLIGFLPDFYYGLLTGYLLDRNPGMFGYQLIFSFTAFSLVIGAIFSFFCYSRMKKT